MPRLTEPRSAVAAVYDRRPDGADTAPLHPNGIGVFWHNQATGKSYSLVFCAQNVLRKLAGKTTDDTKTLSTTRESKRVGDQSHATDV